MTKRPLLLLAALLSGACAVGPDYRRPEAPAPAAWRERPPEGWKAAEPSDRGTRGKWWTLFGDPGLDALEERLAVSNQTLAQAEAQLRAARAAARGARADLFPTVSASGSVTRAAGSSKTTPGSVATTTTWDVAGSASWEADLFGRIRRNVEASSALAGAAAADLESVRLALQAQLAADWYLLRGTDQQIQLLNAAVDSYGTALSLTKSRHDQGVVSGVDVAQAETQLETTRVSATDLLLQRAQLEHAIAVLVGKPPAEVALPVAPIGVAPPEVPLAVPSALLERRPDIAGAERRVAAANAQVGVATAGFFPRLVLAATAGWQGAGWAHLFTVPNRFWSLGPALLETLFDAGKRKSTLEQARAAYDGTVASYRGTVLLSFQEVEDDLAAVRILGEESKQQEAAVAAAERLLALAESRYKGGITTYLEVAIAQTAALGNERAAVQLLTRRLVAAVDLVRDLGGGWGAPEGAADPAYPR